MPSVLSALSVQLRLALVLAALLGVAGTLARIVFAAWFGAAQLSAQDALAALLLGLRFDGRVALVSVAAAWLLAS